LNRGEVYSVRWPGVGEHPSVVVTRESAIPFLSNVTVVLVTRTVRGMRTEVPLGQAEGLRQECVANCDNVLTIEKGAVGSRQGRLGPDRIRQLDGALALALGLD
jgi:mRNA interferase MazF